MACRSRVRIPERTRDFSLLQNVKTGSGAHLTSCTVDTGFVSWGQRVQGVMLTAHPHPLPTLRMSGAIPVRPLYASKACRGTALLVLRTFVECYSSFEIFIFLFLRSLTPKMGVLRFSETSKRPRKL